MRAERIVAVLLLVLLVLLPAAWMVGYAGFYSVGLLGLLRTGLTARWWWQACLGSLLWPSLLLSLTTAVLTTVLCLVTGMLLCVAADHWRVERGVGLLLTLGAALPVSAVAFVVLQMCSRGGLLARGLVALWPGFQQRDFPVLVNDGWSVGIVLAGCVTGVPLTGLFLLSVWRAAGIGRYVELAERLGAGAWRARIDVGVPMLWRRARLLAFLLFVWNFSAWEAPLLLGRQSPRLMSVLIQQSSGQYSLQDRPLSFVFATVYFAVLAGLLLWLPRAATGATGERKSADAGGAA